MRLNSLNSRSLKGYFELKENLAKRTNVSAFMYEQTKCSNTSKNMLNLTRAYKLVSENSIQHQTRRLDRTNVLRAIQRTESFVNYRLIDLIGQPIAESRLRPISNGSRNILNWVCGLRRSGVIMRFNYFGESNKLCHFFQY